MPNLTPDDIAKQIPEEDLEVRDPEARMERAIECANIDPDGYNQIILFDDKNILFVQGSKMLDMNREEFSFSINWDDDNFKTRDATTIEKTIHMQFFGGTDT